MAECYPPTDGCASAPPTTSITVTPPDSHTDLASTGTDSFLVGGVAICLLLVGVILWIVTEKWRKGQ